MIDRLINKILTILRHKGIIKVKKNVSPMRWGVIGLGYMAETFSTAIDRSKDDIVYAVASRNLEKAKAFAANHGHCKAYGSYVDMVHDDSLHLEVVYIATPVKYHYDNIKMCLEAGKNVICEKPITSTLSQLEELMALAEKNNCFLMEGMWMKCLPAFQKAINWIADGKIGKKELVKVDFYKHEIIREEYTIYNASEGGGILRDFGVYAISFMTHFLGGEPETQTAYSRKNAKKIDSDWQISSSRDDIHAIVNLSSNFGSLSKAAVIGSEGYIEWDSQFNRTNRVCLYDLNGVLKEVFRADYKYPGFEYEVAEVHNAISNGKKTSSIVNINDTRTVMKVIEQLMQNLG